MHLSVGITFCQDKQSFKGNKFVLALFKLVYLISISTRHSGTGTYHAGRFWHSIRSLERVMPVAKIEILEGTQAIDREEWSDIL